MGRSTEGFVWAVVAPTLIFMGGVAALIGGTVLHVQYLHFTDTHGQATEYITNVAADISLPLTSCVTGIVALNCSSIQSDPFFYSFRGFCLDSEQVCSYTCHVDFQVLKSYTVNDGLYPTETDAFPCDTFQDNAVCQRALFTALTSTNGSRTVYYFRNNPSSFTFDTPNNGNGAMIGGGAALGAFSFICGVPFFGFVCLPFFRRKCCPLLSPPSHEPSVTTTQ